MRATHATVGDRGPQSAPDAKPSTKQGFVKRPLCREDLSDHKLGAGPARTIRCFRDGRRQTVSNVERWLKTAVRRANERLVRLGIDPISEAVTPQSLRRLYASMRFALRRRRVRRRADGARGRRVLDARLRSGREAPYPLTGPALPEFDRSVHWASMGSGEPVEAPTTLEGPTVGVPNLAQ
jgi:hypothetical protein